MREATMTTIRLLEEEQISPSVSKTVDQIKAAEKARWGIPKLANIWRCMGHQPEYLEVTWRKAKSVRQPGHLSNLTREMIASAVSAANGCRY
jgi:alkylhydroperoxidase/carboxymuconolactone decarboxylase family protein YurZ